MSSAIDQRPVEKRWIHRDNVRAWVTVAVAVPVSIVIYVAITILTGEPTGDLTNLFVSWSVYGAVYAALTLFAFRDTAPDELAVLLRREPSQRTRWKRWLMGGGDGPGTAVTLAAVALVGAALLPRLGTFTGPANEVVLGVTLVLSVVTSWFVVVLSYAVHYARKDAEGGGLRFPDEQAHGFVDYFYFSLAVATTFGTTDVAVTTSRMRRTVSSHSALTFLFNTIIIALLVAALAR